MNYQWPAPGKLNLFLYVTGRREDGYHYLQTLFQFIDYNDSIKIFVTNNGKIRLFTAMGNLMYYNNLIVRAAQLLQRFCWPNKKSELGADIFLNKILPIGSGLGSVSSNAATVLIILNQQWRCYLKKSILMYLGLMLGSDVPIFIYGHSAFAEGVGNILTSICIPEKWYLIVVPPIIISTAQIFKMYALSKYCYSPYRSMTELLSTPFQNDFEEIVKIVFPKMKMYFACLSRYAVPHLTGTGSCLFFIFDTACLAYQAQSFLPSYVRSIVTRGVNISPLHKKLLSYNML